MNRKPILLTGITIFMFIAASISLFRVLSKGIVLYDFHCFWVPGHFIWQGTDPYKAFLENQEPRLPVYYLDGPVVAEGKVAQHGWDPAGIPTNTAPVILIISLLSRFSWPTASTLWTIINLISVILIIWLLTKLLHQKLRSLPGILLVCILFSLIATRQSIELGQTTLPLLACMLAALLWEEQHPIAAGILLGISLSKYSLALPAFLFFIYKRWYAGLATSLVVQLLGVFTISRIGGTTPQDVMISYFRIMVLHLNVEAYDLPTGILKGLGAAAYIVVGIGTLGLLAILVQWYRARPSSDQTTTKTTDYTLFTVLTLWSLLAIPHRHRQDYAATILFIALVVLWVNKATGKFDLSDGQYSGVYIFTTLSISMWSLPLYTVFSMTIYKVLFSLCSLAALALSNWLLFKARSSTSLIFST